MSNGHSRRQPQPGDLIEIRRPAYQHWALYLGDGYIINVVPPEGVSSAKSAFTGKAWVRKQLLKEVVGKDSYCINNKYDATYTPLPLKDIIRRAECFIDQEVCYEVLTNNCEHFVTMLRYGKPVSEQVTQGVTIAGIVTAVFGALAMVGSALSRT